MGLVGAVVRVLAENHHLDLVEGGLVEGAEDVRAGRVDGLAGLLFLAQEGF